MIDPHDFAQRQIELTAEFARYVLAHPEVDDVLPEESCVFFEIDGEPDFNEYSKELARQQQAEGFPVVRVQARGLRPPEECRLIDPVIEAIAARA